MEKIGMKKRFAFYPSDEEIVKLEFLSQLYSNEIGSSLIRKIISKHYDTVLTKGSKDFNSLDNKISHLIHRVDDLHLIESKTLYFNICSAYDNIDEELKRDFSNPKELFKYVYFKEIVDNSKTIKRNKK